MAHPLELNLSQAARVLGVDVGQFSREAREGRYGPIRESGNPMTHAKMLKVSEIERAIGRVLTDADFERDWTHKVKPEPVTPSLERQVRARLLLYMRAVDAAIDKRLEAAADRLHAECPDLPRDAILAALKGDPHAIHR